MYKGATKFKFKLKFEFGKKEKIKEKKVKRERNKIYMGKTSPNRPISSPQRAAHAAHALTRAARTDGCGPVAGHSGALAHRVSPVAGAASSANRMSHFVC